MTIDMTMAFASAFAVLAVSPGPALAATLSRTIGGGYASGLAVTTGLVIGDAIFLAIAMIGLSAIANAMGPLFQIVKYASAGYLIWLGVRAFRSANVPVSIEAAVSHCLIKDLTLGIIVYLGNPKPIIFYGALLPTVLDLSLIRFSDFATLMSVVIVVSLMVYGAYMLIALRAGRLLISSSMTRWLDQAMGVMLLGSGLLVASR